MTGPAKDAPAGAREVPPAERAAVASATSYAAGWLDYRQGYLRLPGIQAAVLHDGELVLSGAWGLADVERGEPLTTRHRFHVASHSKTFTATAVLQLVEQGALRLDDRLGTWLSWLTAAGSPLADRTVRDLLSHAGGVLRDGHGSDHWALGEPFPDETGLRRLALADGAAVEPANVRFKYSNIGYGLLGLVVERASGQPYAEYIAEHVVGPLGLRSTAADVSVLPATGGEAGAGGEAGGAGGAVGVGSDAGAGRLATGYSALAYAPQRVPIDSVSAGALAAATGFVSTAEDLCRYVAAHFPGDERLLGDASKRLMQRPWWPIGGVPGAAYGLGWQVLAVGGRPLLGHGGGWPGHRTRTLFDPETRLAVSVLTNAADGSALELATGVVGLVETAIAHAQAHAHAHAGPARFCGRFADLLGVTDVALLGGRLVAIDPTAPDPAATLTLLDVVDEQTLRVVSGPGAGSRFGALGEPVRYEHNGDGTVAAVRTPSGTMRPIAGFQLPGRVVAPQ